MFLWGLKIERQGDVWKLVNQFVMQCRHCGQPPLKPFFCISYLIAFHSYFFFLGFNAYLCPHSQVPVCNHRKCCIWCHIILCPEYWLTPAFAWAWGRWRKQLTGMIRGLLLMALIETARVECRNAWVIMTTACSYLACSPIFMAHMDFLQSSQCKPGWQVYTHTHAL